MSAPATPTPNSGPGGLSLEASPDSQTTPKRTDTPVLLTKTHRGMCATELQTRWGLEGAEPLTMAAGQALQTGFIRPTRDSWGALRSTCLPVFQGHLQGTPKSPQGRGDVQKWKECPGGCDGQFLALHMEQAPGPKHTDHSHRQPGAGCRATSAIIMELSSVPAAGVMLASNSQCCPPAGGPTKRGVTNAHPRKCHWNYPRGECCCVTWKEDFYLYVTWVDTICSLCSSESRRTSWRRGPSQELSE